MLNYLPYILSGGTGFALGAFTAKKSGAGKSGVILGGIVGALSSLVNLHVDLPKSDVKI